jgi:hypothetical protein
MNEPSWIIFGIFGFIFVIFAILGIVFTIIGWRGRKQAQASQGWAATQGVIEATDYQSSTSTDADGDMTTSYTPTIRYRYSVVGAEYTGTRLGFGLQRSYNNPSGAQNALAKYPVGGFITVYYDPANPHESVLERSQGGANLSLIFGIVFLVVSVLCCCVGAGIALVGAAGQ